MLPKDYKKNLVRYRFDTPLAESGIGGLAMGLAVEGFRPVMEVQFLGFVFEVFDAIAGQIARKTVSVHADENCTCNSCS